MICAWVVVYNIPKYTETIYKEREIIQIIAARRDCNKLDVISI